MAAEKAAWRERFRSLRRAMRPEARGSASRRIVERLYTCPEVATAETVHLFWPLPSEVDLRPLARRLRQRGARVALPVVGGDLQLAHRAFETEADLVVGRWRILEPGPNAEAVPPDAMDVVIVPGLAFGRDGSRLGMGRGYYDVFLRQTSALRVGVVVASGLVPAVPSEDHDVRMDVVVTDTACIRVGQQP